MVKAKLLNLTTKNINKSKRWINNWFKIKIVNYKKFKQKINWWNSQLEQSN